MLYALSLASRPILARLARKRTVRIRFRWDASAHRGASGPGRNARSTRILLGLLAALYPCVVVSGRCRADVLGRLAGVNLARVIGNLGAETEAAAAGPELRLEQLKSSLELDPGAFPGLFVEDKGFSLAVHYRQSPQKAIVRRRILAATRKLDEVSVFGGKQVVYLVVDRARDKGDAMVAERDRLECNWVLYVGDDLNDEDAFAIDGNVVPVRVGRKQRSQVRYYLRKQGEIDTCNGL
jgi:trehalose 6-phosphate phosphatase